MKEITTTTTYNEKLVKRFLKDFYFDRVKKVRITVNILILIIIVYFFTKNKITPIDIVTFVISLLGIIEINSSFIPWLNFQKLRKRQNSVLNTKIKYTFKEHNFKISTEKNEFISYKDLYKVIEIENAYYLYIDKGRAFILDKELLNDKEISMLTKNFQEKVPTYKYKK